MIKESRRQTPPLSSAALGGLIAGAVTGATLAAIRTVGEVKDGKMSQKEAMMEVLRESGSLGIAAAVGVSTTALLGLGGVFSIAAVALVSTGAKYTIDSCLLSDKNQEKENKTAV